MKRDSLFSSGAAFKVVREGVVGKDVTLHPRGEACKY